MTELRIRRAQDTDLPAVQEIARRTIDQCYRPFLGDAGVDRFISNGESDRDLEEHLADCEVLLQEGAVAAFAIHFDDLIHLMMVDAALHRAGLGTALLRHVEDQLFARGNTTIRLETFGGNQQAIHFYKKNGWAIVGKQKDEEHGFTRVLFEKHA